MSRTTIDTLGHDPAIVIVDGREFTADFDDLPAVRALLSVSQRVKAIDTNANEAEQMDALEAIGDDATAAVDGVLGVGATALIFDGKRPLWRLMKLALALGIEAGKAYDALAREHIREVTQE
jgi:hypothetical protein